MTTQITFARDGQALTSSLIIADGADFEHRSVLQLIRKYPEDFETFGRVAFEMQSFDTAGGRQERQVALLNEQHAMLLLTYFKNTEIVRKFKVALVKAFYEMRLMLEGHGVSDKETLTPAQQLLIQQAVGRRAKKTASHYQTIYRAIKLRFQIAKYDQLPQSQLNECLKFINEVDLRVPEAPKAEPEKALPTKPKVTYTVTADFLEKQRTFVYCIRYLFRDPLMQAMRVMQALNVPNANMLLDVVNDFNLVQLERNLENLGYPVKELECYKHLMRIKK